MQGVQPGACRPEASAELSPMLVLCMRLWERRRASRCHKHTTERPSVISQTDLGASHGLRACIGHCCTPAAGVCVPSQSCAAGPGTHFDRSSRGPRKPPAQDVDHSVPRQCGRAAISPQPAQPGGRPRKSSAQGPAPTTVLPCASAPRRTFLLKAAPTRRAQLRPTSWQLAQEHQLQQPHQLPSWPACPASCSSAGLLATGLIHPPAIVATMYTAPEHSASFLNSSPPIQRLGTSACPSSHSSAQLAA